MDRPPLPHTANLFGWLDTNLPPGQAARLFAYRGWEMRKCSRADYEVACEVAELVIEAASSGPNGVLVHGAVADVVANLPRLIAPLARAGIAYSFECYDERFELIHHVRG
ncbi:hypothetical protein R5W24_005680 [Gemmata sp. JC717]|uniref:hypothetical protein n=1 Tax=Gemmata algarum TaxID=2975278 RepID=UPI0021BB07D3|nr:hypothetical protein [Gemmata algarum]MDY3556514.1 hypothetical protein [Gemmata algarum]